MSRKILYIIIGALLFLALLALLWFWLLHRAPATSTENPGGFATSSDRGNTGTTPGSSANTAGDLNGAGGTTGQGGLDGINVTGGGIDTTGSGISTGGSGINTGVQGSSRQNSGSTSTSTPIGGVNTGAWLGSNVSERIFNPSDIANINNPGSLGGTPFISTTPQAAGLGTSGLVLGLTAAGCVAQWAANQIAGTVSTALDPVTVGSAAISVQVQDLTAAKQRGEQKTQTVMQCIVKSIAQAAIDQITRSIVNWINSGFNGQPSFVTNFNQYFANVADQAAGEFIKGSALSFLCSPFAPQIKIAIAQSYANRNGSGATCSLTKITNNVNGFLKGNWNAGGWGGLLQFTTMPTNNPYGAYAYAQIGLNNSIASAQNNANRNISPGGFISVQKCDNVPTVTGGTGSPSTSLKNCKVTTPGQVIQDSLKTSQDSSINQLNIAQDINAIINALTNQLVLKTLYGGLANANSGGVTNPLAPAVDQAASDQAKALLATLQADASFAVQYGSTKQGSASDIQQVQQNFNTLYNCWQTAASSTAVSAGVQAQGAQGASSANTQIVQLQAQVDALNTDITRANAAVAQIQNLQSQVLFAATPNDVSAAAYAIQAAGTSLISQADVTTAQQNRASLQTQLTTTNQLAQSGLAQCHAALGI